MAEVAGIVLGVIPLIVEAIESYEKIGDLILTYRRYSKEVRKFNTEIAVQRVIFQNECVLLLSQVVDDERALHDMFNEPAHGLRNFLRNDDNLDRKLLQRMNERVHDSYKQIVALLGLIRQSLEQIYGETKNYEGELGDDALKPDIRFTSKTGRIMSGGNFDSLSGRRPLKPRSTFCAGATKASELFPIRSAKLIRPIPEQKIQNDSIEKSLEGVHKTRIASDSLCKALNTLWSCPDHPEHSANLRLNLAFGDSASLSLSKNQFSVAVTSWAIEECDSLQKPVELLIEYSTEVIPDTSKEDSSVSSGQDDSQGPGHQLATLLEASSHHTVHPPQGTINPTKGVCLIKQTPTEVDQLGERLHLTDLCTGPSLCKCFHKDPEVDTDPACLGYLSGFLVYRSQPTSNDFAGATPLSRLLSQRQSHQRLNVLDKWKLAGALAMAVLQYHSTPWLQETWMSTDILFFDKHSTGRTQSLESPHLHLLRGSKGKEKEGRPMVGDPFIKNETLFRLGMILLELEFEDTVEGISEKCNPLGPGNQNPHESLARRLLTPKYRAGDQMGTDYGRIVRMCLDCDFGLGLHDYSLDDRQVQRAFYLQIVCQFQKLLPAWEKIYGQQGSFA